MISWRRSWRAVRLLSRFDWGGLFAEVGGVAERCAGFWALEGVCAAAATVGEPGAGE